MPNYRHNNYSFVIGNSFQPFSMQEMLVPFTAYKDAFEQTEAAYNDLTDKSDQFKYLSESLPEGSRARQIYEGYANDLNAQAKDLVANGLNMGNRRALTGLKRRFQGEIGRLTKADEAMTKERELRTTLGAKDPTMLYATDNLSIDDFLDNNTPNLYRVSGNDLYRQGAQAGQSSSSRLYSNTSVNNITKYYQEILQTQGYRPEVLAAFKRDLQTIPELHQAVDDIMKQYGVSENLTGINYEMARQSIINGIVDGAIYKESRNVQQNPGVLTAAQAASDARQRESMELNAAMYGWKKENGKWVKDPDFVPDNNSKKNSKSSSSSSSSSKRGSSTQHYTQNTDRHKYSWDDYDEPKKGDVPDYKKMGEDEEPGGRPVEYNELPEYAQEAADHIIKDGKPEFYQLYWDDDDKTLYIGPRGIVTYNRDEEEEKKKTGEEEEKKKTGEEEETGGDEGYDE